LGQELLGKTENQIDHIAISQKWRKSLLDTRNKRGADIGSDHHLVVAELRLKISASKKPFIEFNKKFYVQKLRNKEIQKKFTIKLENRYQILQQLEEEEGLRNIEDKWRDVKKVYQQVSEEVLGYKRKEKKDWISEDTWKIIQKRKESKAKVNNSKTRKRKMEAQEEYNVLNVEVKRATRSNKRKWIDEMVSIVEEAVKVGDFKELYNITKILSRKQFNKSALVRNKNGQLITNEKEQIER
jgi:hypothetical protein